MGSGKSTLSRRLHQITGLPLVHLDREYWQPNWVETVPDEWAAKVEAIATQDAWIIDGNYGGTMDLRMEKADKVIFMDRSRWLCLFRVLKRTLLSYGKSRPDMAEGCRERFSWGFLLYIYRYNQTRRPRILAKLANQKEEKEVFILESNRAVKAFLGNARARFGNTFGVM